MRLSQNLLKALIQYRCKKFVGSAILLAGIVIGLKYHGTSLYYLALVISAFGFFLIYGGKRLPRYRAPDGDPEDVRQYIGASIRMTDPEVERSFSLHNVVKIEIETTGDGPFDEDIYWIFHLQNERPIRMAGPVAQSQGIFDAMSGFVGADIELTIKAAATVEPALFLIWEKTPNE